METAAAVVASSHVSSALCLPGVRSDAGRESLADAVVATVAFADEGAATAAVPVHREYVIIDRFAAAKNKEEIGSVCQIF